MKTAKIISLSLLFFAPIATPVFSGGTPGGYPTCEDVIKAWQLSRFENVVARAEVSLTYPERASILNLSRKIAAPVRRDTVSAEPLPKNAQIQKFRSASRTIGYPFALAGYSIGQTFDRIFAPPPPPLIQCFTEDTPITKLKFGSEDERTTIEQIDVGDSVLSSTIVVIPDPKYQVPCWSSVSAITRGKAALNDPIYVIDIGTGDTAKTIRVTPFHRFYASPDGGKTWAWIPARDLKTGNNVSAVNDWHLNSNTISSIVVETAQSQKEVQADPLTGLPSIDVYNLTVPETHTYYANDILVHNLKLY